MRSIRNRVLCALAGLLLAGSVQAARLTDWEPNSGGPFSFRIQCERNEVFLMQRSTNLVDWTTFQRSGAGSADRLIQMPSSFNSSPKNFFRAVRTNEPLFVAALVAKQGIDLYGNNLYTDSFDSSNPAYSTNRRWDINKRRDHGDVMCNQTVTNSSPVGNLSIWGSIATGPDNPVSIGPNGAIGSAAWQVGGMNGIQPGHLSITNISFSDVALPDGSDTWLPPVGGILSSGDYRVSGIVSSTVTVAPNATVRLRVDGGWNFAGNDALMIGSNSNIKIYLNCTNASLTGNGIVNLMGAANQCCIFGTPVLQSLAMGGNGEMTCVVYAPHTAVTLHGGGSSDQDFSGAIVADSVKFTGHYTIHFDEDLARSGPRN